MSEPLDRLPDEVRVPLGEVAELVATLEDLLADLRAAGQRDGADRLDAVLARISRWVWPLLGELDEGEQ